MLTDLPADRIIEIDKLLQAAGYNACVFTEVDGQESTETSEFIYKAARAEIDEIISYMGVDARIYVCTILAEPQEFQACAIRFSEREFCIAIWIGVPMRNSWALTHLLVTQTATDFFAVPKPETWQKFELTDQDTFQAYRSLGMVPPEAYLPDISSKLRKEQAKTAFKWLILHEVAHIINGHMEYGRSLNGLTFIVEDGPDESLDENLTSQTLEMDADSFATMMSIQHRMSGTSVLEEYHGTVWPERRIEDCIRSYAFGVFSMIRGFDFSAFTKEEIWSSDHPPGGMRIKNMNGLIATMSLSDRFPLVNEEVVDSIIASVTALENSISEATGIKSRGGNYTAAFEVSWEEYNQRILARWAKLYPTLNARKLSPAKLALPQYDPA